MVKFAVGIDRGGDADQKNLDTVISILEGCSEGVKSNGVGPGVNQTFGHSQESSQYVCVFIVNGAGIDTPEDFKIGMETGYYHYQAAIFAWQGWLAKSGHNKILTQHVFDNVPLEREHDFTSVQLGVAGQTARQYFSKQDKLAGLVADTPEEMGRKICAGDWVGMGKLGTTAAQAGGTATKIPDFTFYGLIRQICGAIDGIFIIANNMAYLLSFKQYYEYRTQYEDLIPRLNSMHILQNSLTKNWTTAGFYNTVSVTYNGGTLVYQHDALVQQYGQQIYYYEFPDDDEETATSKAEALLSAHVRDYSLDLTLTCLYDPQITEGAWLKVPKTLTKTTYTNNNKTKHLDENEEWQEGPATPTKTKEYEIYFVQGYTVKWDSEHSLTMDLHLKYGPDTPEDPINAQVGGGTLQTVGGGGGYGDDCFSEDDICPTGDTRVGLNNGSDALEKARAQPPSSEHFMPRAKQGSNYDKDYKGMGGPEAYYKMSGEWFYGLYADARPEFPCVSEMYDTNPHVTINCADSTRMFKVICDVIGIKCWGWHIDYHYFNVIEQNGEIETVDIVRGPNGGKGGAGNTTHSIGWPRNPAYR